MKVWNLDMVPQGSHTLWTIWISRNRRVFSDRCMSIPANKEFHLDSPFQISLRQDFDKQQNNHFAPCSLDVLKIRWCYCLGIVVSLLGKLSFPIACCDDVRLAILGLLFSPCNKVLLHLCSLPLPNLFLKEQSISSCMKWIKK